MEENLLQSLDQVEAMIDDNDVDLENVDASAEMSSLGEDDMDDSEFLNEYKSTFNFIDSELDALRSSMDDVNLSSSADQGGKKDGADDSSYSSSSDRSPFQMPAIAEMALNMGLESFEIESEGVEELETAIKKMETNEEIEMEQETEMKSEPIAEMESTENSETQVEALVAATIAVTAQSSVELEPIKQSLVKSSVNMDTKPPEEPQVKFEARPQVPPLDQTKKPSHSFHFLTTLISIALAFLTGQRFPKQDVGCHSPALEMSDMNMLLPPRDVQALDINLNNNHDNFKDLLSAGAEYCEREEDFALTSFVGTNSIDDESFHPEAYESLSIGKQAAHAAAIHEALEEHTDLEEYYASTFPEIKTEETFDEAIEFYFEDNADVNIALEETYYEFGEDFGEISAANWATPKLLELMQIQNMETVYVMYEKPYADQSINLHFGVAEYDGLFISMEMMQFIEPLCLL